MIAWVAAVIIAITFFNASASGQEKQAPRPRTRSTTMDPADKFHEIVLPSQDGRIEWDDVAAAFSQPLSLDKSLVRRLFPTEALDLNGNGVLLTLLAVDVAMGDSGSISMTRTADGRSAVKIRVRIPQRQRVEPAAETILDLDQDWRPKTTTRPLIICMHGIGSSPDVDDTVQIPLGHSEILRHAPATGTNPTWVTITNRLNKLSGVTSSAIK